MKIAGKSWLVHIFLSSRAFFVIVNNDSLYFKVGKKVKEEKVQKGKEEKGEKRKEGEKI